MKEVAEGEITRDSYRGVLDTKGIFASCHPSETLEKSQCDSLEARGQDARIVDVTKLLPFPCSFGIN